MKVSWSAVAQALIVALLLAVGAGVRQTYEAAVRVPQLEAQITALRGSMMLQADNLADMNDKLADLKTAIAVLEERSRKEGRAHGRTYQRVED